MQIGEGFAPAPTARSGCRARTPWYVRGSAVTHALWLQNAAHAGTRVWKVRQPRESKAGRGSAQRHHGTGRGCGEESAPGQSQTQSAESTRPEPKVAARAKAAARIKGAGRGPHLEDLRARLEVRQRELNLTVEASRPQQRRVQRVRSVRRHQHLVSPIPPSHSCETVANRNARVPSRPWRSGP